MLSGNEHDLEQLTHDYGKDIFARLGRRGPFPLGPQWWDDRLMQWTMGAAAVKVQLFRFMDVLPMLQDSTAVNRHLREYFTQARDDLPGWMRWGVRRMPMNGFAGGMLARAARWNALRLARRFIAGSNVPEALDAVSKLRSRSLAFTVDRLGEAVITEAEATAYQSDYLELIAGLTEAVNRWPAIDLIDRDAYGPLPRVNLSLKLSSLYSQFDPINPAGTSRAVRARLRPILENARKAHAFVNFDMEQYAFRDVTLRIFREILEEEEFRDWPDVGIAMQAYLRDTEKDLHDLAEWSRQRGTPVWVRLVKGAYWDYETVVADQQGWPVPVFTEKWETDDCFERLTQFLLERHDVLRPAIGSHNIRSLSYTLATADKLNLPRDGFELQMLYGMAEPIKEALVSMGRRVRVYTPYGQLLPGMAYLVRRLLENTANESFLRASFIEHVSEDELLMKPALRDGQRSEVSGQKSEVRSPFKNEPLADFSHEEVRRRMQCGLDAVKGELGRGYPLVIAGREVTTDATIDSVNPSHVHQIVGRCSRARVSHAEQAIAAASEAFDGWRNTPPEARADYFFKSSEIIRRRRFELAAWEVYECGKQWREADADVAEAIDYCAYYAQEMLRLARPHERNVLGEENIYFYEPRGITVVIAPWNFPLAILSGMTAAALVTGNPVIMKPAEQSSVVGAKLMEVFREAGLPSGVVSYLPGDGEEIGPTLTTHPDVALIAFTGSRNVGLLINREAAETRKGQDHVKRVLAEMGGKNAIIVDDDADLDEAVHGVAQSAFGYQGQKCSACSRAIVLESIHDQFLSRLIEATRSMTIAPAEDPGSVIGPLIDEEARRRVLSYIETGKREARLAYAGDVGALAGEGFFVGPHIFADVSPGAVIAQEEIFGPVLAVIRATNLSHALEIANGTAYALTGGLYSRSPENIARVRRELRVGNLYINRKITGALVDRQPFGGFKLSGIGSKAGGPDYLLQFVLPRTITENTMRRGFAPQAAHGPAAGEVP
jgi:RHH-type proline utilization regulon transcriptional repressor/proline dehydrogenase/delta 1-pyrroline-5-carboxylate dehydrogenase